MTRRHHLGRPFGNPLRNSGRALCRGLSLPEVVVILGLVSIVVGLALFALPRRREIARAAACRRNLMQVGTALALYDKSEGGLPAVPRLGDDTRGSSSPLKALLETLVLPDLNDLSADARGVPPRRSPVPGEEPVPGFVCPSDGRGLGPSTTTAPVSYRATTGDRPDGANGGFAPGHRRSLSEVETGDGRSYTAAFSERLIGTGRAEQPVTSNYFMARGPLDDRGCPDASPSLWRGDAGFAWTESSWRSTLYNHALPPGGTPSCVSADGSTAFMGASSAHPGVVNVLIFDGGVRTIRLQIALPIWKSLATVQNATAVPDPVSRIGRRPESSPESR
ncbi:MAG: DUF1559 domain-containing protein [Planctomycetia bacterium]|nr:DUF1559 domain-containing protein [Planctomycetia bacterium]